MKNVSNLSIPLSAIDAVMPGEAAAAEKQAALKWLIELNKTPLYEQVFLTRTLAEAQYLNTVGFAALQLPDGELTREQAAALAPRNVVVFTGSTPEALAAAERTQSAVVAAGGAIKNIKFISAKDEDKDKGAIGRVKELVASEAQSLEGIKNQATVKPPMTAAQIMEEAERLGWSDPDELIKNRVIFKKNIGMLVSETECGKSSLIMQCAHYWGLGRSVFGFEPARPFKTLIIQAENSFWDIAEEISGICWEMENRGQMGKALIEKARSQVYIQESILCGEAFVSQLDSELSNSRAELAIVDPLLAFSGCDLSRQGETTRFLRNLVLPVAQKHNAAILFVHHANKPSKQAATNQQYNPAYSYHGSSDIANASRYIISLDKFKMPGADGKAFFRLTVPKRGSRLKWERPLKYLQWGEKGIYWEEIKDPEAVNAIESIFENSAKSKEDQRIAKAEEKKREREEERARQKLEIIELVGKTQKKEMIKGKFVEYASEKLDIPKSKVAGLVETLVADGQLAIESLPEKNKKTLKIPSLPEKS